MWMILPLSSMFLTRKTLLFAPPGTWPDEKTGYCWLDMTDAISLDLSVWLRLIACAQVHLPSSSPVFIGEVHLRNLIAQLPHKKIFPHVWMWGWVGGCMCVHVHFVLVVFSTAESFLEFFVFIACAFFFFLLFLFACLLCFVFFALSLFLLSLSLLLLFLLLLSNDGFKLSKSYSLEI